MIKKKLAIMALSGMTLSTFALSAQAVNLVQNGSFTTVSTTGGGQLGYNGFTVSNWTSLPATNGVALNLLIPSGVGDTTGVSTAYDTRKFTFWGPGNGVGSPNYSANGFPASSPDGGNYIAADGAAGYVGALQQSISGLTPGQQYVVSFYEAAAQQSGFDGATTEQWQVSLGTETQLSTLFTLPSHGFSGWKQKSLTFTATAKSETLSFLALGTPNGLPPFSLLDGVGLNALTVPEPLAFAGTIVAIGLGIGVKLKSAKRK